MWTYEGRFANLLNIIAIQILKRKYSLSSKLGLGDTGKLTKFPKSFLGGIVLLLGEAGRVMGLKVL